MQHDNATDHDLLLPRFKDDAPSVANAGHAMRARPRLPALLGTARNLIAQSLREAGVNGGANSGPVIVACSGGADSLALAATAAYFQRVGRYTVGAVVVDHQLQPGSAAVAQRTAEVLQQLGLAFVDVRTQSVAKHRQGSDNRSERRGPEAAAREVRYDAFHAAVRERRGQAVLLAHTMNDQAEQVLLGLSRGSGTRSLAGIPARRSLGGAALVRPFLSLNRAQIQELCDVYGLQPWHDPSNASLAFARNRVRHEVLPVLEKQLGPGVAAALARTAQICAQDADALDALAEAQFAQVSEAAEPTPTAGLDPHPRRVWLDVAGLRGLPDALSQRVVRLAVLALGAEAPSMERLLAVVALMENHGSLGPVQLPGGVQVFRQSRAQRLEPGASGLGRLVLERDCPSPRYEEH